MDQYVGCVYVYKSNQNGKCIDGSSGTIELTDCAYHNNNHKWGYLNNQLTNLVSYKCLQEGRAGILELAKCDSNNQSQKWNIETSNSFVIIQNVQTNNVLVSYNSIIFISI